MYKKEKFANTWKEFVFILFLASFYYAFVVLTFFYLTFMHT